MDTSFQILLDKVEKIVQTSESTNTKLQEICNLLSEKISYYNWVGFYFANHAEKTLHLGPYCGDPTDHTCIPFGKGICGQVAESNANFVVPDVKAQDNYIACSLTVKSEIVVPIFVDGVNVGQIDIDSHTIDPFTPKDEEFLEKINQLIAEVIKKDNEYIKTITNN